MDHDSTALADGVRSLLTTPGLYDRAADPLQPRAATSRGRPAPFGMPNSCEVWSRERYGFELIPGKAARVDENEGCR